MADFYIVPPRLTVGTFDRAAVVNSINGLRGDLTFTADTLTGIKLVSYGNNIQIGFIPNFYVKKSGDTIFGNINFTPSGSNYGLSVGVSASDPGTGITGAVYFNTTTNELKIYDNFGWNSLTATGGISEAYANTLYLRLDGTNTPTGNISMGSVLFRLGNLGSTPGSGLAGQIYYNTSSNQVEFYNGTSWRPIGLGITSITAGFGLTTGTNPITTLGTLAVDTYANYTWYGNHTFNNPVTFASASQVFEINKLFISGQSKGDLIVYNGSNWTRVGVGTSGYALVSDPTTATGVTWSLSNANPGGTNKNIQFNNNGIFGGASNINYSNNGAEPNLLISAFGSSFVPLRIKAASSQTADLLSIVNNSDSNLLRINAYGSIITRSGSAVSNTAPIYLQSGANLTYPESGALEFDGQKLTFTPSSTRKQISNIYIGTSAPIGSTDGDFWWNSEQGNLKIYYIDGDGSQYWVDAFSGATGAGIFVTAYVDGIKELNGLTGSIQDFAVGNSGNLFNIVSSGNTHTFNIPIASIASTGLVSTLSQTFSGSKSFQNDLIVNSTTSSSNLTSGAIKVAGGIAVSGNASFGSTLFIFNKNNSNYIGFRYTSTVGSTVYTLPVSTPNSSSLGSSVLSATNDGLMAWVPLVASSGNVSTGDTKSVAYYLTAGTAITGSSNFKYDPDYLDTLILGGMKFVGSGNSAIQITSVGNGGQILSTWNTLNSGLALDASNASLRIVGDTNAIGTLVDFGIYDNSGFPTGNWNSKYLFPSLTEAIFVNGLKILNTTNSDSPITGALNVLGGVGISESASIGGTLYIYEGTGASYVGFRSGNLIGSTIYTLPNSAPQSSLGTSVLSSTPSGILSWVPMTATGTGGGGAGTVFEGQKFAIAYYPEAGSAITGSSYFTNVGTGISILYTAQSTATNNGALVVNGGVGISANLNVGGQINGLRVSSGIVTSGIWAATAITSAYGGIGSIPIVNKGDILVGSGNTWYNLPYSSTDNQVLLIDTAQPFGVKWSSIPAAGSTSISVSSTNGTGPFYLTFVSSTSGSGLAVSVDSNLSYNASTDTLTAGTFSGSLSGFATTSRNLNVTGSSTSTADHYLLWSPVNGGSGVAVSSGLGLSYNPNSHTLKIGGLGLSANLFTTAAATLNLFNTSVVTFNGLQAGTAISIGANIGTFTVNNATLRANQNSSSINSTSGSIVAVGGVGIGGSLNVAGSASNISNLLINNSVITSGSWAGSTITSRYGGTGLTNYTKGDLLVGLGGTLLPLSVGTNNFVLKADNTTTSGLIWGLIDNNSLMNSTFSVGNASASIGSTIPLYAGFGISFDFSSIGITITSRSGILITGIYPSPAIQGDLFWHDEEGNLKIYYDDGVGAGQWVDANQRWGQGQYVSFPDLGAGDVYEVAYYASAGHSVGGANNFTNNTSTNQVAITYATGNTSTSTGAFVVSGGVGIGGSLYANSVVTNSGFVEKVYSGGNVGTGTTIYPNWNQGSVQTYTLTGHCSLGLPLNMPTGASMTLIISQNATGGWAMTSVPEIKYAGAARTVSSAANSIDVINMFYSGALYLGAITKGYA